MASFFYAKTLQNSSMNCVTSSTRVPTSTESAGIATSVKYFIRLRSPSIAAIDCRTGNSSGACLLDWQLENVYAIYPQWLYRYAAGVTHNTEHLFGLRVARGCPVRLNPREHTAYQWLPYHQAAEACFSPSNAEAILQLPRLALLESVASGGVA